MDKIFQILAVLVLLILLISRFIKGREARYRPYDYLKRLSPPLPPEIEARLKMAVIGAPEDLATGIVEGNVDLYIADEDLVFCYGAEGRLTILSQSKVKQELPVPLACTAMALDPTDGKLYFEVGEFIFLYGP